MTHNTRYTQAQASATTKYSEDIQPTQAEALVNPFSLAKASAQEALSDDRAKYYYGHQVVEGTGHASNKAGQLVQTGMRYVGRGLRFATIHAIADTYKVVRFTGLQVEAKVKVLTWNKGDKTVVPYEKVQDLYTQVKGWLDQAAQMPLPGQTIEPIQPQSNDQPAVLNPMPEEDNSLKIIPEPAKESEYEYVEPMNTVGSMGFDWGEYGQAIEAPVSTPVPQEQPNQDDPIIDTASTENITAGIRELQLLDMATATQLKKEPWASMAKAHNIEGYQQMKMAEKKAALTQAINTQFNLVF